MLQFMHRHFPFRFRTIRQTTQGSLSNCSSLGRSASFLIRTVPFLISFATAVPRLRSQFVHVLKLTCLRQTESNHRIIRRVSAIGTIGLYRHEQRRNGNPIRILSGIEDFISPQRASLSRSGKAGTARLRTKEPPATCLPVHSLVAVYSRLPATIRASPVKMTPPAIAARSVKIIFP